MRTTRLRLDAVGPRVTQHELSLLPRLAEQKAAQPHATAMEPIQGAATAAMKVTRIGALPLPLTIPLALSGVGKPPPAT
jgi:hypothetical protein